MHFFHIFKNCIFETHFFHIVFTFLIIVFRLVAGNGHDKISCVRISKKILSGHQPINPDPGKQDGGQKDLDRIFIRLFTRKRLS